MVGKKANFLLSALYTLLVMAQLGEVPAFYAASLLAEERGRRGLPVTPRMVKNHLRFLLEAGLAEPAAPRGRVVLRVSERGREVLEHVFGCVPAERGAAPQPTAVGRAASEAPAA